MMIALQEILNTITPHKFVGNKNRNIKKIVPLNEVDQSEDSLAWCNEKNIKALQSIKSGTIICPDSVPEELLHSSCNYILVPKPRQAFQEVMHRFFYSSDVNYIIEKTAIIHPSAKISSNVKIGHYVVIEEGVTIGEYTQINHNTVILKNTQLGSHVKIGCNCTIGGDGFGYEKNKEGNNEFIPHIGIVIIDDYVEIGNNNTIDRATLGTTYIGKHVKTDNVVHIGHNCKIGENTLMAAGALISGSVKMGAHNWVGPSATITNNIAIGENSFIAIGSVALKPVGEREVIFGNPGKFLKKNKPK